MTLRHFLKIHTIFESIKQGHVHDTTSSLELRSRTMSTEFILIRPVGVSALLEEGLNSMHAQGPLCASGVR